MTQRLNALRSAMNAAPSSKDIANRYATRGQFRVRDRIVNIPATYQGKAVTAVFPISYARAEQMIDSADVRPAKLSPSQSVVSVTAFDFHASPVGPYSELVYAVPVLYRPKWNCPLLPLVLQKAFRGFGYYVLDILQSTEIAIEHGDLLTGYPHNRSLIGVTFCLERSRSCVKVFDGSGEILALEMSDPKSPRGVEQSYLTYCKKNSELLRIKMDIYGVEERIARCELHLGDHALSKMLRVLGAGPKSLQTRWYRDVTEVNPVSIDRL